MTPDWHPFRTVFWGTFIPVLVFSLVALVIGFVFSLWVSSKLWLKYEPDWERAQLLLFAGSLFSGLSVLAATLLYRT